MSVRKDKRNQSKMDFFKYADRINEQVTRWLLTNFGEKKIKSDINHIIKDISMEDQKQITDIFNKYDIQSKYILKVEYPEWYITHLRECIFKIISDLWSNITHANSIYSTTLEEANTRRLYQDEAIANCYDLLHQMQNAANIISFNLNQLSPILDDIDKEISLLKGWRQSDNKIRKKLQNELDKKQIENIILIVKDIILASKENIQTN